jgi:hypothetical protein
MIYLLGQAENGRITLDRECHGSLLKTIKVDDPPVIRREIDGKMVDCSQHHESFAKARAKVETKDFVRTPEGWFARKE